MKTELNNKWSTLNPKTQALVYTAGQLQECENIIKFGS
jgi:hypothetical protein